VESLAEAGLVDLWLAFARRRRRWRSQGGVRVAMVRTDVAPYFETVGASIDLHVSGLAHKACDAAGAMAGGQSVVPTRS
jgi:hypothetical protein